MATSLTWKINSQPFVVCSCLLNTYIYMYLYTYISVYSHLKIVQNIFPSLYQIKVVYILNTYEIPMLTVQHNPQHKANPKSLILLVVMVVVVVRVPLGLRSILGQRKPFFVASLRRHNFPLLCNASLDASLASSSTCSSSKDCIQYD